jgi:hypothetical protein
MTDLPSDIDMQGGFEWPSPKKKPVATTSIPYSWRGGEQPAYVVRRRPFPEHDCYEIWVTHDVMKVSPIELNKMLADLLQSQVKLPSDPETTLGPAKAQICQCKTPTQGKQMEWGDQYCGLCGLLI